MTRHSPSVLPPSVLSIAGSDSGGGAGIQADLKTFEAFRVHGLTAITAITAQNTRGVSAVHAVPTKILRAQIDAVFEDFSIGAVKIGMLGTAASVRAVAAALRRYRPAFVVLDPVMIATSGARLIDAEAIEALRLELAPLADLITPNLPEAEALVGFPLRRAADFNRAAKRLLALGCRAVLLKGGHAPGKQVLDRLYTGKSSLAFAHPRLQLEGHGTGCSLASAIAAGVAAGKSLNDAVRDATDFIARALAHGYRPGQGEIVVLGHAAAAPRRVSKAR